MKNTNHQAAKFFASEFGISIEEAKSCNHLTINCMVKYASKICKGNRICMNCKHWQHSLGSEFGRCNNLKIIADKSFSCNAHRF